MKKMYRFSYPKCLQRLKTCCAYVECTVPVNLHVCIYVYVYTYLMGMNFQ